VVPNSLQGVELWGVGREVEHFHLFAMVGKPQPNGLVFVVRSIVLDQIDFAGKVASQSGFEILDIGVGVENLLEAVKEPKCIKLDGAEDF
jgi:hypothetical protein